MPFSDQTSGLSRDNVSVAAAGLIRDAIMDGRIGPGQRLKESALAAQFGISRTPIREALTILQTEGLITTAPHRGSVVRAYASTEVEDMFQLRARLEAFAAQRACERRTDEDLVELESSIDRLEALNVETEGVVDIWRENVAFHMGLARAAHTAKLVDFLRILLDLPVYYQRPVDYREDQKQQFVRTHRAILGAVRARDVDTAEVMVKAHILEARNFAMEQGRQRFVDHDLMTQTRNGGGEPAESES